ncbi:unnamed protein product [Aphanomyces euteiches]|uniref:LNR domain-containing protein n=1 Tax=Aphanomyces euteiches TaxID=100861 RepID=A0A6G0WPB2_9STRA|nr:hypothetical protein Ae201684_013149 [Aphanomyces euteiches]KAH9076383.1 hypothetical protein Ae201684P_010329 [Aphanomyces euteiches]
MQVTPVVPPLAANVDLILLKKWPWCGILCFAVMKHVMLAIYLSLQAILSTVHDQAEQRAGYMYNPDMVALVFFLLSSIHVSSIVHVAWKLGCCPRRLSPPAIRQNKVKPKATIDRANSMSSVLASPKWIILFNLVEIICQSYEGILLASKVSDRTIVGFYIVLVVLHAILTPLLFVFRHSMAKVLFTNVLLSWISLALSCLIHLFCLILPLLHYKFIDSNVARDPLWLTKFVLYVQYNTVTTPVDFGAKSVMQLGALVTLWRLQAVGIKYFSKPPDRQEIATNSAIAGTTATSKRVHRGLSIYLACSVLWGVGLFGSLLQALWIRQPCPPTCQAALMNLWDSTCQCMFVHVNCVQTNSQDVDSALQTSQLGVKLYAIQVSQCDLVDGIANATMHQFPALSYVSIQFTKTKAWDGQLPNSISFFTASDNMFATVPAILDRELPPSLVSLSFSHQPMATSPVIPQSWKVLSRLEMTNVNLSAFVNFTGFSLVTLRIANNNLTQWPPSIMAMPSLLELDISGNALQILPWKYVVDSPPSLLRLCGNPVQGLNRSELFPVYQKLQSASCLPVCAPQCFPYMVGNYVCDLACFNAACGYDAGDCQAFAFT